MQSALYDSEGRPRRRHRPCPVCDTSDELGSYFNDAWCARCGWRGTLSALHAPAVYRDLFSTLKDRDHS